MNTPFANTGISPQARELLERSLAWLQPKGRWHQGWGILKNKKMNEVYEIDYKYEFENEGWREFEDSYFDFVKNKFIEKNPFENLSVKDVTAACALGSLLVNNDGEADEVYEEAARALADLVIDSKLKAGDFEFDTIWDEDLMEYRKLTREELLEDPDFVEELVVGFNDAEDSDGTRVKNLFRRVLGRRTY